MTTTISDNILAAQTRMAEADRKYEATLQRNASFTELYGLLMETDERELAMQYAAEQQAINAQCDRYGELKAEFAALGEYEHADYLDLKATQAVQG